MRITTEVSAEEWWNMPVKECLRIAKEWWNANSSRFIDDKDWWDMPVVLDAFAKEKVRAAVKECLRIAKAEGDTPLEEGGNVSRWDACDNVIREIKARFAEELK